MKELVKLQAPLIQLHPHMSHNTPSDPASALEQGWLAGSATLLARAGMEHGKLSMLACAMQK